MSIELYEHQKTALPKLKNGSILCGGVGSGKSRTALAYFLLNECGGSLETLKITNPRDLYIITTARKRDTKEWVDECVPFNFDDSIKINIDSWNNIGKYTSVCGAFFIFDEQRVVGYGAWTKAFLAITKKNNWILLSATPGDTWSDYIPVFIANGFYKNKTEFVRRHIVYSRYTKYPKVDRYLDCGRLIKLRKSILVNMAFIRPTKSHHQTLIAQYDKEKYLYVTHNRKEYDTKKPFKNIGALCLYLRQIVNSDPDRIEVVKSIIADHPKTIIFYNFDYELDLLRQMAKDINIKKAEWNGHIHEPIPDKKYASWIYLVQYTAGAEGWNCVDTDTIIFYSQNYSYRIMTQSAGRIDRLNTPYQDLYYYHIRSNSSIDISIMRALQKKKNFNARGFSLS